MTGPGKETANFEGFYARFAAHGLSPLARGFLLGYCVHLIADARFQRFIRDPGRVKAMFARLKRDPAARERLSGQPETFDAVKAAFGKAAVFRDVAAWRRRTCACTRIPAISRCSAAFGNSRTCSKSCRAA